MGSNSKAGYFAKKCNDRKAKKKQQGQNKSVNMVRSDDGAHQGMVIHILFLQRVELLICG